MTKYFPERSSNRNWACHPLCPNLPRQRLLLLSQLRGLPVHGWSAAARIHTRRMKLSGTHLFPFIKWIYRWKMVIFQFVMSTLTRRVIFSIWTTVHWVRWFAGKLARGYILILLWGANIYWIYLSIFSWFFARFLDDFAQPNRYDLPLFFMAPRRQSWRRSAMRLLRPRWLGSWDFNDMLGSIIYEGYLSVSWISYILLGWLVLQNYRDSL